MTVYDVGDEVTLAAPVVLDTAGQPADATVATLTITLPDQTTATPPVLNPPATTGRYVASYVVAQHGRHVARWEFTGAVPAQVHADVFNAADPTWPAIVGLAEVRKLLKYADGDTSDDEDIRGSILCVSQLIEDITGDIAQRTHSETYSGGQRAILLRHRPVQAVTSVTCDGSTVDPSLYTFSEHGVLYANTGCWPRGFRNVAVVYRAGRLAVAPATLDGALELIRINWRPRLGGNYSAYDGESDDDFGASRTAEGALQGEIRLGFFIPYTVMHRLQPTARAPHIA